MQIMVQSHETSEYKFYLSKIEWVLAMLEKAKLSSNLHTDQHYERSIFLLAQYLT